MSPSAHLIKITWWRHQMETYSALLARSPVNFPHKNQWLGALMFSLICARRNGWVNTSETGNLRRHRAYYDITVMTSIFSVAICHKVHDTVISQKHFPTPVDSPHKCLNCGSLIFLSLLLAWTSCWTNNHVTGDLWHQFSVHANVIIRRKSSLSPFRCQAIN